MLLVDLGFLVKTVLLRRRSPVIAKKNARVWRIVTVVVVLTVLVCASIKSWGLLRSGCACTSYAFAMWTHAVAIGGTLVMLALLAPFNPSRVLKVVTVLLLIVHAALFLHLFVTEAACTPQQASEVEMTALRDEPSRLIQQAPLSRLSTVVTGRPSQTSTQGQQQQQQRASFEDWRSIMKNVLERLSKMSWNENDAKQIFVSLDESYNPLLSLSKEDDNLCRRIANQLTRCIGVSTGNTKLFFGAALQELHHHMRDKMQAPADTCMEEALTAAQKEGQTDKKVYAAATTVLLAYFEQSGIDSTKRLSIAKEILGSSSKNFLTFSQALLGPPLFLFAAKLGDEGVELGNQVVEELRYKPTDDETLQYLPMEDQKVIETLWKKVGSSQAPMPVGA
ncbi:hypothetical protein EBZ80_23290 [bacterium]|nr:hypothetical protein [bacterium]